MNPIMGIALAALVAAPSAPVQADSLGPSALGTIYCAGVLTHDMTEAMRWMTPDLAAKVAAVIAKGDPNAIRWASTPGADRCIPVGAQGTAEVPLSILYYTWSDNSHRGFSDQLVTRFVNDDLRIDDVNFTDGTTLRQQLGKD